jgi:hypothetical protein
MWVAYTFIAYLVLALTIPVGLSLAPVWRGRRGSKQVRCPLSGGCCSIALDPWHAVRMHALGEYELRVRSCTGWPERCDCAQECLAQIAVRNLR